MLRLSLVRATRPIVPKVIRWSRWKSGGPIPSKPESSTSSQQAEELFHGNTLRRLTEMANLQRTEGEVLEQVADLTEVEASDVVPKVAQNEAEPFGSDLPNFESLGLRYDPTTLPLRQQLDPFNRPYTEEEYAMTLVHGRSVNAPYFHQRTHDIPVANIHFRSHHIELLNLFTHFATHAASSLGIPCSRVVALPTKRTLWTVLRSPFAHKKSQENFERRVHKRAIKAWDADPEVIERWVRYLRAHALAGVGMRVTTWDRVPLGIGSAVVRSYERHNPAVDAPKRIKQLGKKIVEEEQKAAAKA